MDLVPNRECGECSACCEVLLVDEADLQKLPGVQCPNCRPQGGCAIHDIRPAICRGFFCAWRSLPHLAPEWRPDKSGILVRWQKVGIPAGYHPVGLNFLLFRGPDVIHTLGFPEYLGGLIVGKVAVYLSVRGPVGYADATVFMNDHLAAAAESRDRDQFVSVLSAAAAALQQHKFEPAVLKHGPAAVAN